jgi:predicted DNA-binding transcriptional regulator AlpA
MDNRTPVVTTSAPSPLPRLLSREELHLRLRPNLKSQSFLNWLWKATHRHGFPRPLLLAGRSVAWREDEVRDWVESRPRSNRQNGPRCSRAA